MLTGHHTIYLSSEHLIWKCNVPYLQCFTDQMQSTNTVWLLNITYIKVHGNKFFSVKYCIFRLILSSIHIFEYGSLQVGDDSSVSDCSHRYCYHHSTRLVHSLQQRCVHCSHCTDI